MALNVNIIGRDSKGNLRALKVNSEGNLDFGQLETEIQAVKDNQGRLYGKYGEVWIPVKVDSEGRPIIASDVTVTADGLIVDLGQIKQGPAGTEPWPVQLSGTIVELAAGTNTEVTAGSTVTLYENTTKQFPGRSIRAAVVGYSPFNKAQLAIRFWSHAVRMSANAYAVHSEVFEANTPSIQTSVECKVYGGHCRVALTNLMTTDKTLVSFVVLGVI